MIFNAYCIQSSLYINTKPTKIFYDICANMNRRNKRHVMAQLLFVSTTVVVIKTSIYITFDCNILSYRKSNDNRLVAAVRNNLNQ